MIFPKECQPHLLIHRKNYRFPALTLRDGRLIASDNRVFVSIKVDGVFPTHTLQIDPEAIKAARKAAPRGEPAELDIDPETGTASVNRGPSYAEPNTNPVPAPPELEGEPTYRLGINAKLLHDLSKALGGEQLWLECFEVDGQHGPAVIRVRVVGDEGEIVAGRFGLVHPVTPR